MKFVEIEDKKQYDEYVLRQRHSQFLQSWEWGEFQKENGLDVKRFGVFEDEELKIAFSLIKTKLVREKFYYYCPRVGVKNVSKEVLGFAVDEIRKIAKKEKVVFLRFEPRSEIELEGFNVKKSLDVQPSKTVILDLKRSEEELLAGMHQKTRYNIRLAKKKGVSVEELNVGDFGNFWKVMEDTSARDGFRLHSRNYYRKMIMMESGMMKVFVAKFEGEILAANIISYFGDMVTYVHGASSNEHRNLMAPYLLQWEVIKDAKAQGYDNYDFHGIDEDKWPGVTRFKRGFKAEEVNYPGVYDIVFCNVLYELYKYSRIFNRWVRRVIRK